VGNQSALTTPRRLGLISAFVALILCALLVIAGPASADHKYNYDGQWGEQGTKAGEFASPFGLDVSPSDDVYVYDTEQIMVQRFDSDGQFISRFSVAQGQDWYSVGDIAVASSGDVFVTDLYENKVYKFDVTGDFVDEWTPFSGPFYAGGPFGIDVDGTGDVWVVGMYGPTIKKFDSSGNELLSFGSQGDDDGEFYYPTDISVTSTGRVYVADSENQRVQWFDTSGVYQGQFDAGVPGSWWQQPAGLATDQSGDVFLTLRSGVVQRFGPDGTPKDEWGGRGSADGRMNYPFGIGVGTNGRVYVADVGNRRIQYFYRFDHTPSTLTMYSRNGSVNYGNWEKLAGFLKDATGDALAGRHLNVRMRASSGDAWSWVNTRTTMSNGYYQVWFKPTKSGEYRAYFNGDKGHADTWSGPVQLTVDEGLTAYNYQSNIQYGRWAYMPGALMDGSGGIAGKNVYLQKWDPFGKTWLWVATKVTDGNGQFAFWFQPGATRYYRVHRDPDINTPRALKTVRAKVVLRANTSTVAPGRSVRFTGWVTPSHPGQLAYLQWYDNENYKWKWLRTIKLTNRAFTMTYDAAGKGPMAFRLYYPGHWQHGANTSRTGWITFQ